jgi:hypothetical protein
MPISAKALFKTKNPVKYAKMYQLRSRKTLELYQKQDCPKIQTPIIWAKPIGRQETKNYV